MDGPHSRFTTGLATLPTYCALIPSSGMSPDFSGQLPQQDRRITIKGRVFARLPFLALIASPGSRIGSLDHCERGRDVGTRPAKTCCGPGAL